MNLHEREKGVVKRIAFVAVLLAVLAIALVAAPPETDADTIAIAQGGCSDSTALGDVAWTLEDAGLLTVEEEAAGPMPAAFFTGEAAGITVNVIAEAGAFDQKVEMELAPVYDSVVLEQIAEGVGAAAQNVTAIDITFVNADGEEVEPLATIKVTLTSDTISETARIAHMGNDGNIEEMEAEIDGDMAKFESGAFSVYAVVDDPLTVKFVGLNGEIASMYVKKDDNMEQVIYDPGAGDLDDDVFFRGWTTNPEYTSRTPTPMTIADVRVEIDEILNGESSVEPVDNTVTYYAMLFKSYEIAYYDEHNISLGQESVVFRADDDSTSHSYSVNMAYHVESNEFNFEGWLVTKGSTNIVDYVEGKAYQNNENISITGDVEFGVYAPEGHWLVFNENGKGAKYNAARFLETEDVTEKPCDDSEMTRLGYTFGGWYKDAECTDGNEFEFGYMIDDFTTIYAKWIPNNTAGYSVLIWKQNLDRSGYDFAASYVGTKIDVSEKGLSENNFISALERLKIIDVGDDSVMDAAKQVLNETYSKKYDEYIKLKKIFENEDRQTD